MQFSEVIGQRTTIQRLKSLAQNNRLSHALLFLGKEGSGALPLANAFAQYLVCDQVAVRKMRQAPSAPPSLFEEELSPAEENVQKLPEDSCGQCPSCLKASGSVHPDIHYSYPVVALAKGDKPPISADYSAEWRSFIRQYPYANAYDWLQSIGAENRQGNITARECSEIIHKLSFKSFESGFKILIMWMPEYLGEQGNKLLKLIEEPPDDTLFFFVAEQEARILPTILSRTQLVRIPPIAPEAMEDALVNRAGVTPEKARPLAAVSEGNYREALSLLQHNDEDWQSMTREWLNAILKNGPVAVVRWVDDMSKFGREKQKQFLLYVNHLLEESIRLRIMGDAATPIPDNEVDFATRLNKMASISQQQAMIREIEQAAYLIERNAHGKMLFHALSIKIYHIIKHNSLILIA